MKRSPLPAGMPWGARRRPGCEPGARGLAIGLAIALSGLVFACHRETAAERRARQQRALRKQRLRWVRYKKRLAAQERAARARYLADLERSIHPVGPAGPPQRDAGPLPDGAPPPAQKRCDTVSHLSAQQAAAGALWTPRARLLLAGLSSQVIGLGERVYQRFSFVVRIHPAEEPRFGRPRPRPEVWLAFRWRPTCGQPEPLPQSRLLRLRLRRPRAARPVPLPRAILLGPGRWPRPVVPVGAPVEVLLDTRPPTGAGSLRRPRRARPARPVSGDVGAAGLWSLESAQFSTGLRRARLHLATSAFGPRLARLAAVEVPCKAPAGRCRFLTYSEPNGREFPIPLDDVLARAQPVRTRPQARQIFEIIKTLRYPGCSGEGRRVPTGPDHPCLGAGPNHDTLACQYYRAVQGMRSEVTLRQQGRSWHVSQTLRCEDPRRLRILALQVQLGPGPNFRLTEHDLSRSAAHLEEVLRRMKRDAPR